MNPDHSTTDPLALLQKRLDWLLDKEFRVLNKEDEEDSSMMKLLYRSELHGLRDGITCIQEAIAEIKGREPR